MKQRNIWFAMLTLLLVWIARKVSKYGRIGLRWIKGAAASKPNS